ncbi:MAG: GHKL domain-containing protein [Bacteroidetes bacterium]|nr:GHKL domain-containing protein [Bacteroidota bacterium]
MIGHLKKIFYRHGYLLITAAWLYTISFLFTNYFSYSSNPQSVSRLISQYIISHENSFAELLKDTVSINGLISDSANSVKQDLVNDGMGIFAYQLNDVGNPIQLYWNTNSMAINKDDLARPDGHFMVNNQNGYFEFIKETISQNNRTYIIATLIPVQWHYFIENKYLQTHFAALPQIGNAYHITSPAKGVPVLNAKGETLFKISKSNDYHTGPPGTIPLILRFIAIILAMIFLNFTATSFVQTNGFLKGFSILAITIFICRGLSYFFAIPAMLRGIPLFDPLIYASSALHPSLGDLLINVVILFWLLVFIRFNYKNESVNRFELGKKGIKNIAFFTLIILPLITCYFVDIILSLVKDSTIPFNVTDFFSINIYTIITLIIICFLSLSFYYLMNLLEQLRIAAGISFFWRMVITAVSGLVFLSLNIGNENLPVYFMAMIWLLIYLAILLFRQIDYKVSLFRSTFFIFWAIFFILPVTILVTYQNRLIENAHQKNYAYKLALQSDSGEEFLLKTAITGFSNSFFGGNFSRFYDKNENKFLKDSIINNNFSGYLNKYDTRIYAFDNQHQPLFNQDNTSYDVIMAIITSQGRATNTPGLYFYENSSDHFGYIYYKNVFNESHVLQGDIFVIVDPKTIKNQALVPELFKESDDLSSIIPADYSYAIYNKNHLVSSSADYTFSDTLIQGASQKSEFFNRKINGFNELWYFPNNQKAIIVVKNDNWFLEALTLFAYLFCLFIIIVVIFHYGSLIFKARFRWKNLRQVFNFNIRAQIQTIILSVSIFSFIIIGIATISFFIYRFDKNNKEKLTNISNIMVNQIEAVIRSELIFDDNLNISNIGISGDLERKIVEISEVQNTDVNFYDVNGNLKASSQPYIFNKQVLSDKMNPDAYYQMHYNFLIKVIENEKAAQFSFLSIYQPIKDEKGMTIAYLNVPYLNSQNELKQEISNFLVTLINLNALIFILGGTIALFITRRITSSFSLIGNKMKEISLGKVNEEIVWKRNDELGLLVKEYNKMLLKLEESAQALGRSEREGAWREMARQVAHEIKNPLTPMKLSIQYLQRAIDKNDPNVKDLSRQVASTLVEQIDQLSQIAGDFSQFANIASARKEKFNLNEMLSSLTLLFQSKDEVEIVLNLPDAETQVYEDKTQINRLFTNLIKNAIEASTMEKTIHIEIAIEQRQQDVLVTVADHGIGISKEMQAKIFTPNFTTKTSGTGLGLAICKGIVENSGGSIWFQTKEYEGTTFYVTIPVSI